MLEATKLDKAYGAVRAVSNVSLTIDGRMIYGIIGPNGAGKSTLFRLLSGFERPDSGSILFEGRYVEALAAHERARMGIVRTFQELELLPALTAGEVLTTAALLHRGLADARDRANEVADQLEIPWHALASELNPGMARRIELARCMLAQPKLVLFDEVMAGLTVPETDFMCENIAGLHSSGVSIIIVEHVMRAVRALCRHIYVMSEGQLIAEGSPENISRDAYVREAYLGKRKGTSLA